jgi:hypothetical protein
MIRTFGRRLAELDDPGDAERALDRSPSAFEDEREKIGAKQRECSPTQGDTLAGSRAKGFIASEPHGSES